MGAGPSGWRPGKDIATGSPRSQPTGQVPAQGPAWSATSRPGAGPSEAPYPPSTLVELPDEIPAATAAALPLAGLPALRLVRDGQTADRQAAAHLRRQRRRALRHRAPPSASRSVPLHDRYMKVPCQVNDQALPVRSLRRPAGARLAPPTITWPAFGRANLRTRGRARSRWTHVNAASSAVAVIGASATAVDPQRPSRSLQQAQQVPVVGLSP